MTRAAPGITAARASAQPGLGPRGSVTSVSENAGCTARWRSLRTARVSRSNNPRMRCPNALVGGCERAARPPRPPAVIANSLANRACFTYALSISLPSVGFLDGLGQVPHRDLPFGSRWCRGIYGRGAFGRAAPPSTVSGQSHARRIRARNGAKIRLPSDTRTNFETRIQGRQRWRVEDCLHQ